MAGFSRSCLSSCLSSQTSQLHLPGLLSDMEVRIKKQINSNSNATVKDPEDVDIGSTNDPIAEDAEEENTEEGEDFFLFRL